ncbi:MAG: GNAT family protein [Bryobacteraceae bacterium]
MLGRCEPHETTDPVELRFERSHDMELVRQVMTDPKIWPWICDDSSPALEEFQPVDAAAWHYLTVFEGGKLLGLFLFVPQTGVCWEVHTCLLPGAWGPSAAQSAREAQAWIWEQTPCRRIVTSVPIYNRLALRFALAAGMTQFGRDPASIERGGRLWDRILLGVSKPPSRVIEFRQRKPTCPPQPSYPPSSAPPDPSAAQ